MKWLFNVSADAVLLQNVQVLTLYKGRYTTARRSGPVSQLQCVGGSAGCRAFVPEVVQCQNRGWDGVDVQVRPCCTASRCTLAVVLFGDANIWDARMKSFATNSTLFSDSV